MWFVYTASYGEIEWEKVYGEMSALKKIKQWLNVKFLVKLGKSGGKINKMLSTECGEDVLKPATVYKWVKHFQEGCEDIDNDVQSGHPSSSYTEENVNRYPRSCLPIDE